LARRRADRIWIGGKEQLLYSFDFPGSPDSSNDDLQQDDEDNEPQGSGWMYFWDAPEWSNGQTGGALELIRKANFEDYLRVNVNGEDPSGAGLKGSRASVKRPWYSKWKLESFGGAYWNRSDPPRPANDIQVGGPIPLEP
jgi:hypothetical protein